jgi:hypothetical protein
MIDGNGKQTITNDGATVMKVHYTMRTASRTVLTVCSFWISSTQPHEFSQILPDRKMRRSVMVPHQWWCWQARY